MKKVVCIAVLCLISSTVNAENVLVGQARKAGVKRCMPAVEKIANFLIQDGDAGVYSIWNTEHPDKQAFSAVIERNYSDATIVTNLNVTPVPSGECYIEYEKIMYSNKSCMAAAQKFKDAEYTGEVNKKVGLLNDDSLNIYLIPAGDNCIVMSKEVIMDGL